MLAFLAELFDCFEVDKVPCVRDVTKPLVSVGQGEGDGGGEGDGDEGEGDVDSGYDLHEHEHGDDGKVCDECPPPVLS